MKQRIQIIPKDTEAFKLPNRVIGSGRITRRVVAYKNKRNGFKKINQKTQRPTRAKKKVPPIKLTSSSKRIWEHWRTKGYPFIRHQNEDNRVKYNSIRLIKKALKDYSAKQIVEAIDLAHDCFKSRKYKPTIDKLACDAFFKFSKWQLENLTAPVKGDSWFKEFVQGQIYVDMNYAKVEKDTNPEVTAMVEAAYRTNQKYPDGELTISEKNALIKCADKVVKFTEANGLEYAGNVIAPIERIINNPEKPFNLNNPYFLCSADLWERQLPREMVRYGTFQRRSDIHLI